MLLIDQHGLLGLPLLPGMLGNIFVDLLTFGPGVGGNRQAREFLVVLAALHHAAHAGSSISCLGFSPGSGSDSSLASGV